MDDESDAIAPQRPRSMRAPTENGAAVIEPGFDEAGRLIDQNVQLAGCLSGDLGGMPLAQLRREARAELYREARTYTATYADVPADALRGDSRMVLAGHQPQLFHPGVWFKNFALDAVARQNRATAINLVIDSDTLKTPGLYVPGGPVDRPTRELLFFDRAVPGVAYEARPIVDAAMFAGFAERVTERMTGLIERPWIASFWPDVCRRAAATGHLGEAMAQARHRLELAWGAQTLEVPQSRVCDTASFRHFAVWLLAELPRWVENYNDVLRDYRQAHRLRSAAQPMPDLAVDDSWREAPFWIYNGENPQRRRFFARNRAGRIELRDGQGLSLELPLGGNGLHAAADALAELSHSGVKIRSRALVTTLWARLALGDLFLHGIGGANYDRITDRLFARLFGLQPPAMMVLSATLHLPIDYPRAATDDLRRLGQQQRELTFHPETQLSTSVNGANGEHLAQLIAEKRTWAAVTRTRTNARKRTRAIRAVNEALQPFVAAERARLAELEVETRARLAAQRVFAWREYSFCLFPESVLREFLTGLLPKIA